MPVEFQTLGTTDLRDAGGQPASSVLRQPKRLALLAYLAFARPRGFHQRDELLALLWPEMDESRARAALRKTVHALRSALGADVIAGRGDDELAIELRAFHSDVYEFEAALADGRPRDAAELFRGDFLRGFHADASPAFERWLDAERQRLRLHAAEAASTVAMEAQERGDLTDAVRWGRCALALAPLDEGVLRRLLLLLDEAGERAGALEVYQEFIARLAEELDVDPSPETAALVGAIRARAQTRLSFVEPDLSADPQDVPLPPRSGAAGRFGPAYRRWGWLPVPLAVLGIAMAVVTLRRPQAADMSAGGVAVLEFTRLSPEPDDAFLARGLAEETSARLARLERFPVASAIAARRFRAGADDPATIGAALGVTWLVSGNVQRTGQRLRVNVELVRARDGAIAWSGSFETTENDFLAIEDSLAPAVAHAIAPRLPRDAAARLASGATRSPRAFEHYLRGRYLLTERNPTAVARAIDEFGVAASLDSTFADVFTQVGFGYALFIDWEWQYEGATRDELFALTAETAEAALARDSLQPGAWWLQGFLAIHRDPRAFAAAQAAFDRALVNDPRHAPTLHSYGIMEARRGNDSAATALLQRALAAEPGRPITLFVLSELRYRARAWADAERWLDSALAVEPGFFFAYAFRALARLHSGNTDGARRDAETAIRYSGGDPVPGTAALVIVEAALGDSSGAQHLRERLDRDVALRGEAARTTAILWLAMADLAVNRTEAALGRLQAVSEPSSEFWFWLQLPEFDPLRRDPEFVRLAESTRPY